MSEHDSAHVPGRIPGRPHGRSADEVLDGELPEADPADADPADADLIDAEAEAQLAESYERLEGVLGDYRSAAHQSQRPSTGLRRRILEIAELEAARGPSVRLRTRGEREFSIAASTVRRVVRDAVDEADGLVARRVRILQTPPGAPGMHLRVSFVMRQEMALREFEEALRERIVTRLATAVGVSVRRLELVLEDLEEAGGRDDDG